MEVPKPIIKNQAIVDAIPKDVKHILEVGAGCGELTNYLRQFYKVDAIDIKPETEDVLWGDILNLDTLPVKKADLVICSEVLEHLHQWEVALDNIMRISNKAVITVPYKNRVYAPDHVVYFDEEKIEKIKYKVEAKIIVYNKVYLICVGQKESIFPFSTKEMLDQS